ncbi:MAG: hypothetical protein P4L50_00085 [Anaerolineaceae bacterium]|nr:hypothetical protein [Anaerolineaceae bacterium]
MEQQEYLETVHSALHYAAVVALACKGGYGVTLETYNTNQWLPFLARAFFAGDSEATAAFLCVNEIQKQQSILNISSESVV